MESVKIQALLREKELLEEIKHKRKAQKETDSIKSDKTNNKEVHKQKKQQEIFI